MCIRDSINGIRYANIPNTVAPGHFDIQFYRGGGYFTNNTSIRNIRVVDLDSALLMGVEMTIEEMEERKLPVHRNTLQARDWLRNHGVRTEG